ncbi:MAG: hypothetical protein M5U08_00580 [Burkholderiales bacterium]|nr:hypothetical protein [Burkholderiales bacterium]
MPARAAIQPCAARLIGLVLPLVLAESVLVLGGPLSRALVTGGAMVIAGSVPTNRPAR